MSAVNENGRQVELKPTGLHKFYSETRRDWVSTKEIHDNEVIRGRAGPLTIVSSRELPGTERVYNLTVEGEHVYYVSELGLLAHNNCNKVLRAVSDEEVASILAGRGIVKKTPAHKTTPDQHIGGTKHSRDPFTSTTRSADIVGFYATRGGAQPVGRIVEIDLSKIDPSNIIDVSTKARAAQHLQRPFTRNAAAFDQEVLIRGNIPQEAIRFIDSN